MASKTLCRNPISSPFLFTTFLSLLFIISILHTASASSNSTATSNSLKIYKAYIKKACNSTTYPKLCYNSLSSYASKIKTNPLRLTMISLSLAQKAAKSALSTITKLSTLKGLTYQETEVIADCKENIDDTVYEIKQSLSVMKTFNGSSYDEYQWDNIKTWMSSAITDESTCTDEFDEMEVRPSLQKKINSTVVNVATITSNSLSLINNYKLY
ncbi:hypothetical protein L6164_017528 [Bauhinia variegata]|uniref:Uncharacterized protein n=1 Tax=Bauhinia variegata TaxID=167791 RepID=A0ACB9N9H4_BAUVA|nr:hypothetical protein L6164_017528 [Bauhinia variegata]